MRHIRVFNKNIGRMVYTTYNDRYWYDLPKNGKIVYGKGFNGEKEIFSEPMEYIEREDKHKKELCEGDIVKWINNYGEENIGWIRYNKYSACFVIVLIKGSYLPFYTGSIRNFVWGDLEKIGTIYENDEMMKEVK